MMKFDGNGFSKANRVLPEERAVAISVCGSTHAVMMATPHDLEDFAYGFLLTDGVIKEAQDIDDITVVEAGIGVDVQVRLRPEYSENYRAQRRAMIGPVGCGLCGVESLEIAMPELEAVQSFPLDAEFPWKALQILQSAQEVRNISGAIHGAAMLDNDAALLVSREDIGRHNAMDKVIGSCLQQSIDMSNKVLVISSRVSLDLVIKAVRARIGTLIARATPSDLAYSQAAKWGLQLIAPVFSEEYFSNKIPAGAENE